MGFSSITSTANVTNVMAGAAVDAAADTMVIVGDFVSRRQGDGKHKPRPSLRRCSMKSNGMWEKRSTATAATTATATAGGKWHGGAHPSNTPAAPIGIIEMQAGRS